MILGLNYNRGDKMPVTLYNEGRVVGYSAYEIYVKQQQSIDPDTPPASERQWLASTIAMGSSMLLQVDPDTNHEDGEIWVYEHQFPDNTALCAANTIVASFFTGDANYSNGWANRVTDYGKLISNTAQASPNGTVGPTGTIPLQTLSDWNDAEKKELTQYLKIVDGIIIQPGTWSNGTNQPPQKDFKPDLSEHPRIRILFKGPVETQFQILLTGFTIRTVVQGVTGLDSATASPNPENGDFLGPGQFPWAAKIMFSIPSSYVSYFASNVYKRELPSGAESLTVDDTSVVDMKTTKPETYYETNYPDARVLINVAEYSSLGDGTAVLTIYQKKDKYPPALYGTFVDSEGQNYLNPIDVVAPGTIKMFENATEEELKDYEDTFDGTFAINKNTEDGTIEIIGPDGTLVPMAKVDVSDVEYTNIDGSGSKAKKIQIQAGKNKVQGIAVSPDMDGTQYTISSDDVNNIQYGNTSANVGSQNKISPPTSNVTIPAILDALANDKSIDILGNDLKVIKAGIPKNYIQFPNGLRLYISSTEPPDDDVPIGSIGIGWGFYEE